MQEAPERLTPLKETVRELYLKSGNECAFPDCHHRIINSDGVIVAEMCHIEAALPGGERFNPNQTNEERRSFGNLMLMCHAHHKVTDNTAVYTVERLKEMKAAHEAKFTDIEAKIGASIVDRTKVGELVTAASLNRMNEVLGWNHSEEELLGSAEELADLAHRMKRLPIRTRQLVAIVVERGSSGGFLGSDWRALHYDVVEATGEDEMEIVKHVSILQNHGIGAGLYEEGEAFIELGRLRSGWNAWDDIRKFCELTSTPIGEILVDLRFDLLD